MLKLIVGGLSKPQINFCKLYGEAFIRKSKQLKENLKDQQVNKQYLFLGIKFINASIEMDFRDKESIISDFMFMQILRDRIALLTPAELLTMFPVEKTYDGAKRGTEDYFYTMENLCNFGMNDIIGDNLDEVLWCYVNPDLDRFMMNFLYTISDLERFCNDKGLLEKWAEEHGLTTYSKFKDQAGREFRIDHDTGKTMRVKKIIPEYLKLVVANQA